jgi:UDP-3-O-[3-hydroxymyristoyl] glucosamine N-acyltransferase
MMTHKTTYTLQELAELIQARFHGDKNLPISGVAGLEEAKPEHASFLANPRYEKAMMQSHAGVIVVSSKQELVEGRNFLITEDPSQAFQKLIELFSQLKSKTSSFQGIHPTAVIHESAKISENVTVGPLAVIDANVTIGQNSIISASCFIGAGVQIGSDTTLYPHVTIREGCVIGSRVVIQPGAVIGSCGYGYIADKTGKHNKLNQVGNVVIEDDVEIGANTTIDRARFQSTVIGEGTKVDNLVQIAHGVKIGKHSLIIAQTGIAGSTEIGNHVILAGQVAVNGHIKIADQVVVAARSGVSKSLTKPGKYGGVPVLPLAEYNRMAVLLQNIEKFAAELKLLKKKVFGNSNPDTNSEDSVENE